MIVQNMKGTNLYNKYAIRSVGIIKEKKIEKQLSLFPYYCNQTIPRIKFINVSKTLSGTSIYLEAKGIFTLLYPNYTGMDSVSPIVKGVCETFTKHYKDNDTLNREYYFISEIGFEIFDLEGNARTFICDLLELEEDGFNFKVSEILKEENNDTIKPLKYMLGITKDDGNYVEPFVKTLELNNIKIHKGDFEHVLMAKKNTQNMSDSSDTKVSYKLFAYKGIGGWGVITVPELISDKFYAFCVEKEWRYFQFR